MAALGDSITQATNSCGYKDCPNFSWSTGSSLLVWSHATRLKVKGASHLVTYNDSVSGATSADLLGQAQAAVAQGAGYATIEIGANDACTASVATMTSVPAFTANITAALSLLSQSLPSTRIFVASIPNLQQVWSVSKNSAVARLIWRLGGVCPSMLADPLDTSAAANARRAAVEQRVTDFNAVLAQLCGATTNCTFDRNVVANYVFTSMDVSPLDFFHPSIVGEAKLAAVTWPVSPYGS